MANEAALQDKPLPSIRDHAKALQEKIVTERGIQPDAAAAVAASEVPAFSRGTTALDPNTGRPIVAPPKVPAFADGGVAMPADSETTGGTPQATATPAAGQTPAQAAADAATAPATTESAQQAAGTQAADAVAQQIVDAFAEYEQFDVDDPDLDLKVPVRVPKQFKDIAKRGFPRRADYDRMRQKWGDAAPIIEPLIADGRFKNILPLIQMALADPTYGDYVVRGYQRAQAGLPLLEAAVQEAAQMRQVPPQQQFAPPQNGAPTEPLFEDPLVNAALAPVLSRFDQIEQRYDQRFATIEQQRAQQEQSARQQQQQNANVAAQMQAAHADLARMYPGYYDPGKGPNDPNWQKACEYARSAGYVDSYGLKAAIIFGAQGAQALEQERLAATASPAAAALQQVDQRQVELARQQALAAGRAASGGAPTQTAPPPAPRPPNTRNADGSLKPLGQFVQEAATFVTAGVSG